MQYRQAGKTGISLSILGFGGNNLAMLPDGSIDEKKAIQAFQYGIQKGINYADTGSHYMNSKNEEVLGKALRDFDRDKFYITAKVFTPMVKSADEFEKYLNTSLERLATDYVDFYMFHALNKEFWENVVLKFNFLDKMREAKATGKARHLGFSFHDDLATFQRICESFEDWEMCLVLLNYTDGQNQAGFKGIKYAHDRGMGVAIMEPLKGGRLANPPGELADFFPKIKTNAEWCFDYLWHNPHITTVVSGMKNKEMVAENIMYADRSYPGMLSAREEAMYVEAGKLFASISKIDCGGCKYCQPCPNKVNVPEIIKLYNESGRGGIDETLVKYRALDVKADDCVECGFCKSQCPRNLDIPELLKLIARYFEREI